MDRVLETLDIVRLRPPEIFLDRYPHELSGGTASTGRHRARDGGAARDSLWPTNPSPCWMSRFGRGYWRLLRRFSREAGLSLLYISHDIFRRSDISVTARPSCTWAESSRRVPRKPSSKTPVTRIRRRCFPPFPCPTQMPTDRAPASKGDVPSPVQRPEGCVFHPRCPEVFAPCGEQIPGFHARTDGQEVACHLYREEAGDA